MLKKIFKAAKKAAPIIGAGLGFLAGGPVLGSALGGGLGSLIAGKSPKDALKFAALSGLTGGALSKFGGLQAGQGLGGLFKSVPGQTLGPAGSGLVPGSSGALTKAIASQAPQRSVLGSIINFAKANPGKTALGLSALGALAGSEEEKKKALRPLLFAGILIEGAVYGTMNPFRDLGDAGIGGVNLVPFSQYGPNLQNRAMGGEINGLKKLGMNEGGFPRKNGKIAGPGTETSDDIPAMLSDGEFVVNARTVRGLGRAMGGDGTEDTRDRGSKFLYSLQNKYGGKA